MTKELVKLYAIQHAIEKLLEKGNCSYVIKTVDGDYGMIEYAEINNELNKQIKEQEKKEHGSN